MAKITLEKVKDLIKMNYITQVGFIHQENGEDVLDENIAELDETEFYSNFVPKVGIVDDPVYGVDAEPADEPAEDDEPKEDPKAEVKIVSSMKGELVEGGTVETEVSIAAPEELKGTMVFVKGYVTPVDAIASNYEEGDSNQGLNINEKGEFQFGANSGFPLTDAVTKFNTTINKSGEVTIKLEVIKVEGNEVLAISEETVTIAPKAETIATPLNTVGIGNPVAPAAATTTTTKRTRKKSTDISVDPVTE